MKNLLVVIFGLMSTVISTLVFAIVDEPPHTSVYGTHLVRHDQTGMMFPNESTMEELPEYLPCVKWSKDKLTCSWIGYPKLIIVPADIPGEYAQIPNEKDIVCRQGRCRSQYGYAGDFPKDLNGSINFWYTLQMSTDGKPIAVRRDMTEVRSYTYAGVGLYLWYLGMGPSEKQAMILIDRHYHGGWKQLQKDWLAMCEDPNHDYSYCGD